MTFSNQNPNSKVDHNQSQNGSFLLKETFDLEDFFEDEYIYFANYEDEKNCSVQLSCSEQQLTLDDEIPRKTLADIFPDSLH
jgi:K+-transporting ATPase c subunit